MSSHHQSQPQILPELPLEIQYLILESSDWLQQSILRQVCKTWQDYIDTSDTLLDDCYKATIPPCLPHSPPSTSTTTTENDRTKLFNPPPRLHNVINYRSAFVRTRMGFTPCIFHKNDDGEVVDWSPEADLTIYLSDPLLKPGTGLFIDGMDVISPSLEEPGTDGNDNGKSRIRYYETLSTCDHGSVASYLRDTVEGAEAVGRYLTNEKYFRVSLSIGKTEAGDIRLRLFVEPECAAGTYDAEARGSPTDEQAGALISQLSISQSP
ncbi:hypothetical protein TWF481_004738 [Arthrobotrys musiformis]|uniref:F-box domain-containing protein n=1 Tax=Arthrobotrys musiformis TaxID=47236 RepID=A0AAV9WMB7_9PEZI